MKLKNLRKYSIDVFKIIHSLDKWLIPVILVKSLFVAAVPFVVIVLSAEVINILVAGGEFEETLIFALISVGVIFALTTLGNYFTKVMTVRRNQCARLYDFAKNIKSMEMDYAELENPAIYKIITKLNYQERAVGFSFARLLEAFDDVTDSVFTALIALVFLAPFFVVSGSLPLLWTLVFIIVSVVISIVSASFQAKSAKEIHEKIGGEDFWPDEMQQWETMLESNVFTYKEGKDIRIYGFAGIIKNLYARTMVFFNSKAVMRDLSIIPAVVYATAGAVRALIMGGSFVFVAVFMAGETNLGNVLLLAGMLYNFTYGISFTIAKSTLFFSIAEVMQLYLEFIKVPESLYKGSIPVEKRDDNEYEIEFKNVSFKYPGSDNYALKNLSFKFNIGKRVAVVGMNGSGKTTMIKLLCRLFDPTEGEITLNGVNITKYSLTEYQNIFSVVFQDFKLFSMKLGQVLASDCDYDSEKAVECLERAGLGERFDEMPQGLETYLYKDFDAGVEVSGGEAQKIALARALYKNSPVIVLDEPTAALDPISEFEVYSKFNEIIKDKTAIFISHRLSSCKFCDDIAVFHEGELIQRGGHDELVADEESKYFELWNAQAQYYVSG
ncbi:MAG: ABC transporter ATP-binding protein/permease [Oscillospiraceae bacterium]|nr:ABC transporter ATP-binding protein/permease [Oscillospiraceae bacterium]